MDKGIGFSRTILLDWLDVTASLAVEGIDSLEIRQRLGQTISDVVKGSEAQRKTIDVLIAIWVKSEKLAPSIYHEAISIFPILTSSEERLWLHYGMSLVYYPFFRKCAVAIGQISRIDRLITRNMIKDRIAGDFGHLGGLDRSVERIIASLTDWGILSKSEIKNKYMMKSQQFSTFENLQSWLLSCVLYALPSEFIPADDLVHLPELYPFKITLGVDQLRRNSRFEVQRQGGGLEMVRTKSK